MQGDDDVFEKRRKCKEKGGGRRKGKGGRRKEEGGRRKERRSKKEEVRGNMKGNGFKGVFLVVQFVGHLGRFWLFLFQVVQKMGHL